MQQITEHLFGRDTRLVSAGADIHAARLTERWNTAGGNPNGRAV
ncbi:hypothetical protein GCM10009678_91860 [Actinomadura kijaniata]|uniref:Uncharacterized protein n=1 Tax=Actinomadura namibiensis TaxID=182080 RepID=A0A7W3LT21_ACTNM|nr:hypothetical protein [Actinomadura namibiensis]MBA8953793.1 hypothetical protein [Actinomadura namibiensis]